MAAKTHKAPNAGNEIFFIHSFYAFIFLLVGKVGVLLHYFILRCSVSVNDLILTMMNINVILYILYSMRRLVALRDLVQAQS